MPAHSGQKRTDACWTKAVDQELHGAAANDALVLVNDQPVLLKKREDCHQVTAVLGDTGTGDKDVIQVQYTKVKGRPPSKKSMSH
jgi:hypothetical protein